MLVTARDVLQEMSTRLLRQFEPRRSARVDPEADRARLLATSSQLQATATVVVMLELIDEGEAEEILVAHRRALEGFGVHPLGVRDGELTLGPTSACGFQPPAGDH